MNNKMKLTIVRQDAPLVLAQFSEWDLIEGDLEDLEELTNYLLTKNEKNDRKIFGTESG